MEKDILYEESITLKAGHSLIISHKPDKLQMYQVNDKLEAEPQELEKFGLFDVSSPNYNTYYPEVTEEDLKPNDSEFIEPVFRMLSNVTVHSRYNPIYFPETVLKKSMYKLIGQTVNVEHETAIGNAIGTVKSVEWQKVYTANGVKVPAGINAVLKIDGKSNPRIARGIMMDPPAIHANSVTVNFKWKKSHPELSDEEFRNKLASYDKEGKLIQKIATDIIAYHETSLVSHGADPFAQKVGPDGKIVLPNYANERNSFKAEDIPVFDWKDWKEYTELTENKESNNQNFDEMDDILRFIETFFGFEKESLNETNYQDKVKGVDLEKMKGVFEKSKEPLIILDLTGKEVIEKEINTLRAFKASIPEDLNEKISFSEVGKNATNTLRVDTERLYKLSIKDGKEDDNILSIINGADYKTLESLHKQYEKITEGEYSFTCKACGSHDVTRASADPTVEGEINKKGIGTTRNKIIESKKNKLPSWLKEE